jgi:hypothetical protein
MLLSPAELHDFYERLSVYEAVILRVSHDQFSAYCRTLGLIQRTARSVDGKDSKLYELLSPYRRFMYDAQSAPIPFSSKYYDRYCPDAKYNDRIRNELTISYRDLTGLFDKLTTIHHQLTLERHNPLLEQISKYAGNTQFPLVVRRQRFIEHVQQAAADAGLDADVSLPSGVQQNSNAEIGFAAGFSVGPADQFPQSLRRTPMARRTVFVEYDWIKKIRDPDSLFLKPFVYSPLPKMQGAEAIQFEGLNEQDFVLGETPNVAGLREYALQEVRGADNASSPGVPAQLVFFQNGWMAFLSADDSQRYNIVQARDGQQIQIVRKRIRELKADDPIVLRLGGTSDYVEEVADKLLLESAEPFRYMQRRWKKRLGGRIERSATLELTAQALRAAGCSVSTPQNIRHWLAPRSIGLAFRSDWRALCSFCGISTEEEEIHWQAICVLRRMHVRAGNLIRTELLQQLKTNGISDFESTGNQIVKLAGHDDIRLILLSFIQLDENVDLVPASQLEQPFRRD